MSDDFRNLIHDAQTFLRSSFWRRESILASAEDYIFFQTENERESLTVHKEEISFEGENPIGKISKVQSKERIAKLPFGTKSALSPQDSLQRSRNLAPKPDPAVSSSNPTFSDVKNLKQEALSEDFSLKKTLQRIAPSVRLVDSIPDDTEAKKIANAWKEKLPDAEVVLLACDLGADTLEFLKTLAKAIDQNLAKTKILLAERYEKEKRWSLFLEKNLLRLIILSDGFQRFPELMHHYKAIPANAQFFLGKIPLLPLSPSSTYRSLEHKASLWKSLCQMLKK